MDYKYEIGDAVLVRSDLSVDNTEYYMRSGDGAGEESAFYCEEMMDYAGKVVHISDYSWDADYYIEEDDSAYHWTDDMFVGLADVGVRFNSLL